ncbi:serine protease [Candidatus Izemoplasma sp. B36]|uniref:S1 family peptidase n=1 Tax=Candidatus Izemoplasma sp. B36 TaxID=3242468 RepID=UPI003556E9EC
MKLKRKFILLILILFTTFLVGCDEFFSFNTTTAHQMNLTTLPTAIDGTITFEEIDYTSFSDYVSPTYSIDDINEYNDHLEETRDHIRHCNIQIQTTLFEMRYPHPLAQEQQEYIVGNSSGSGFVFLEEDGYFYAITNFHVIDPQAYNSRYEIMTYADEEPQEATVVAYDEDYDLAVIKFETLERTDVEILNIYERLYTKFIHEELVFAIGNPLGVTNNVSFGEFKSMQDIDNTEFKVIYHDALIEEGSSGGALVDVDGNLLGVNAWGLDTPDEYSFAIPNYIVYVFLINNGVLD